MYQEVCFNRGTEVGEGVNVGHSLRPPPPVILCFLRAWDEIKPRNKNQEISQQSLRVSTFFRRKPFLLQFLQSSGTCSVREQFKVILQIWWSRGNLFVILLFWRAVNLQMNRTVKYQGAFSRIVGFAGKRFLFSPPPPNFFFLALTFAQ